MTGSWWYAQDGKAHGPLLTQRVLDMFMAGELTAQDWLWQPGMQTWERAGTLPAFTQTVRNSGAPFSTRDSGPAPATLPSTNQPRRAGPWTRLFAQWMDIYLLFALLSVLLALNGYRLERDGTRFLAHLLILPVGLMIQAALLATIGTTPGKAMLDLRVRRWDGALADLRTLVRRQGLLLLKGMALGVPLINLITAYLAKKKLDRARLTVWDEAAGTDVYQTEHRPGRLWLCVLAIVLVEVAGEVLTDIAINGFGV